MAGRYNLSFIDYGDERSSMGIWIPTLTNANTDATLALLDTLKTATDAMTLGNAAGDQVTGRVQEFSGAPAGSVNAQRENKWLVSFTDDTTGSTGTTTIPTAMLTLLATNSDKIDMANATVIAWIAAFEAVARSKAGNEVTVNGIKFVGRNL